MTDEKIQTLEEELSQILVNNGVISEEEMRAMQKAFRESDVDQFDEFLLSEGLVDQKDILEALSEYFEVPAFDVTGYFFERHLLHMFPKQMLVREEIIPLEVDENMMIVIASHPNDPELLAKIGENVSYDIRFYVGIGQDIIDAIEEFYDSSDTEELKDESRVSKPFLMGEFIFHEPQEPEEESSEKYYEEDFED